MTTIRDAIIGAAENLAGHTVNAGPTISDALDALTDVLAGEDVQGAQTIADAFAILGDHLDDNAPSGKITITENGEDIDIAQYATADVSVSGGMDLGRTGTVSLKVNDSYEEPVTYVPCVYQNGPEITYVNIGPESGDAKFAQGVYVMGIVEGLTPTACTYKVGDSGTPQQGDTFVWTTWNMPAFGFVMPDATENDLGTFVEITAEAATENPGNVTPA